MKLLHKLWMVLPLLLIGQVAQAVAPANSTISNTATLTYTGNATGIKASVSVKVVLLPTKTTVSAPTDNTVAESQSNSVLYTIVANANGPDVYKLTSAIALNNITGAPKVSYKRNNVAITTVTLGATASNAAAAIGATTISVPSDGAADNNLNGLINGDEINIAGQFYLVNVTDNASGTSTLTLKAGTLSTGAVAPTSLVAAVAAGALIKEQQVFSMVIDNVGNITNPANASSTTVTTTATSQTNATVTTLDIHVTNIVAIAFEKLVRNVTVAASNPATGAVAINGVNYYPTQATLVSSVSTDVLEYAMRVKTPAKAGLAGAVMTDPVPTFTTYVGNSTRLNGISVNGDSAAVSPLIAGLAIDDNVARVAGAVATGIIAKASVAVVTFQVTVD